MKKIRILVIIVAIVFLILYSSVYFFVIPEIAENSVPYKWRSVAAGLNRDQYQRYLGTPGNASPSSAGSLDEWVIRNGNYTISLHIEYATDSTASAVTIAYSFSNYLFRKKGLILNDTEK